MINIIEYYVLHCSSDNQMHALLITNILLKLKVYTFNNARI